MSALSYVVNDLNEVGALKVVNKKGLYTCSMPGGRIKNYRKVFLNGAEKPVFIETRRGRA